MKKTFVFVFALSTLLSNAQDQKEKTKGNGKEIIIYKTTSDCDGKDTEKIIGNGKEIIISKTTAEYDGIYEAGGFFDVELVSGKEGNIKIKGEENLLDLVNVEVDNNILKISIDKKKQLELRNNKNVFIIEPTKKMVITVPFDKISTIKSLGSGNIYTQNKINGASLDLKLMGSGDMKIDTDATEVTASLMGSGDIILSGKTADLDLKLLGSGDIDSGNLLAGNARAKVLGSGDIKVNCTGKLSVTVLGPGNIQYKGKPQSVDRVVIDTVGNSWRCGSITSY